jgi:hypothetical protein
MEMETPTVGLAELVEGTGTREAMEMAVGEHNPVLTTHREAGYRKRLRSYAFPEGIRAV